MGQSQFKRIKNSEPDWLGFVDEDIEETDSNVSGIYEEGKREEMLENGEINPEEYGFMEGWDDALD